LLASLPHLDALRDWILEYELRVVVIDPLYLCLGDDVDPANLFSMGRVLRNASELCQAAGVTLVVCHHTKKNIVSPYEPAELEDISWSGTQEWARQWLLLSRREKYIPGTGLHRLWLSSGGSAGHGGYWGVDISEGTRATLGGRFWQAEILTPEQARAAVVDDQQAAKEQARQQKLDAKQKAVNDADQRRVVQVLGKFPGGETKEVVRTLAGISGSRVNAALAALIESGDVLTTEIVKPNRTKPYPAFTLKADV
jgi:hypothetical protein